MLKYFSVLAIAILSNAGANILIKMGMNKAGGMDIASFPDIYHKFFLNPLIWCGVIFFGIALLSYSYVLSHIQLSIAYPIMTSLGFVVVVLVSLLYLGEKLNVVQFSGIAFIIFGVWLLAK